MGFFSWLVLVLVFPLTLLLLAMVFIKLSSWDGSPAHDSYCSFLFMFFLGDLSGLLHVSVPSFNLNHIYQGSTHERKDM